ncbi:hypothetical protein ACIQOU_08385 [Streptomyces sp. NPDC091279]|uniref:hypothetical protein n=1 Tax=Streptomyces sp. NPDC091279 TaxID=3365983 RepID=UPI00381E6942
MTYVVTVDICLPEGAQEMDPLQRAGAVALIEDGFEAVEVVEGPDGLEADLFDSIVAVHPAGALLKVFVDAPRLESAEEAVRSVVTELLDRSQLLTDWRVARCEVELHSKQVQESLDAADGPGAPPTDPAARKAHHARRPTGDPEGPLDNPELKAKATEAHMLSLADELRAFPAETFGAADTPASQQDARLAAGALVFATNILLEELFQDVHTLTQENATAADCDGPLWHFEDLPERYALQYDARFARRFLVTVIALTTRFTDGSFQHLSCVAEELALRLLLTETQVTLETLGLLSPGVAGALEKFTDTVYEDKNTDWLYTGAMDAPPVPPADLPMAYHAWFTPFTATSYTHPTTRPGPEGVG